MSAAIRTENLSKRFGAVAALRKIDLEVPENAIYALVGPNGAGKTTAIKVLMNIMAPSGGRAEVMGNDSRRIAGEAFTSIGYVSENQEMPDWMTVNGFFDYLRPFYPNWNANLENEMRKQFDLPGERKLRHLSRGMKMKAALASSLAYRPRLIMLDEPFGGLDPLVRDQLIEAILERAAEATVFISSHDLAEIESFASHVGYLENGRLLFSEEMTALNQRFREVEVTLGTATGAPERLPQSWMQVNIAGSVARFTESSFDAQRTGAEIRNVFGEVRDAVFTPMSLREIFLAMAKAAEASRKGQAV